MSEPRVIVLGRGFVTIVDAADYDHLTQWRWGAKSSGGLVYAGRTVGSGSYATSCGGEPWLHVYGNTERQKAVVDIEKLYGAERIAELEARVRELEAKLNHLRNLLASDDIEARRLVGEIKHALGVTEGTEE